MPDKPIRAITILILAGLAGFAITSIAASLARIANRIDLMAQHIEQTQCIDESDVL